MRALQGVQALAAAILGPGRCPGKTKRSVTRPAAGSLVTLSQDPVLGVSEVTPGSGWLPLEYVVYASGARVENTNTRCRYLRH